MVEDLKLGIGSKESIILKPALVKIETAEVIEVGGANGKKKAVKVNLGCKHPDTDKIIYLSNVKYEAKGGQLKISGLWVNKDVDNLLQKGSALVSFMLLQRANCIEDLKGKEVQTLQDGESGFLVLKGY